MNFNLRYCFFFFFFSISSKKTHHEQMAGCKNFLSSNLMSLKNFFFFFLNCMSASAQLQAPFYLKFYLKSVNLISSLACGYTTRNICGSFAEQMLQRYAPAIINKTGYSGLLLCSQSTQSSCVCVCPVLLHRNGS